MNLSKEKALAQIEKLKAYIQGLEGEWKPEMNEEYFYAYSDGFIDSKKYRDDSDDLYRLSIGNIFKTEKQAEQYKLRLQAMKPKFLPKMNERYWSVGDTSGEPFSRTWRGYLDDRLCYFDGTTFKTEQEALDWYATYKSAFEV